ncbi:MAG: hypothetical protein OXU20_11065, partial [Myxococcales bacterium]|nr:hypothetical protein [Myxococcales bacterium]
PRVSAPPRRRADFVIEASGRVVGLLVVEHPDPCFLDLQLVGMDPDAFALELGSALAAWVDAYCEDHSVGLLMLRARDGLSADPKRWKSQRMCVARGLDALQQLPGLCGWVRSYPILIQISRADCVAHAPGAPSLASLCRSLDVAVAG